MKRSFFADLTEQLSQYVMFAVEWHSGGASDGVRHDGETKADMFRRFGKGSEVPEAPDMPECGEHILQWFWDLSARRAPAMAGVSPISFGDIDAWRRLLGVTVRPEEVKAILAMDDAYRRAVNESQKKDKPKPREEPPPKGFLKA